METNDEPFDKPQPVNKPMDKESDVYTNERNVYGNKLNKTAKDSKCPRKETSTYYEIKFDNAVRAH